MHLCFQNPLLEGADLSTMISMGTGSASYDADGKSIYRNRRQVGGGVYGSSVFRYSD